MPQDLEQLKHEMSRLAVRIGSEGFGIKLDYSNESIKNVEKILGKIHDEYKQTGSEDGLQGIAFEFASYIVKVIEKNVGPARWQRDHAKLGPDSFPLAVGEGEIFPVSWCIKRIYDGPGDDVWFKYNFLVLKQDPPSEKKSLFGKLFGNQ